MGGVFVRATPQCAGRTAGQKIEDRVRAAPLGGESGHLRTSVGRGCPSPPMSRVASTAISEYGNLLKSSQARRVRKTPIVAHPVVVCGPAACITPQRRSISR